MNIFNLPKNIIFLIIDILDIKDRISFFATCKYYNNISSYKIEKPILIKYAKPNIHIRATEFNLYSFHNLKILILNFENKKFKDKIILPESLEELFCYNMKFTYVFTVPFVYNKSLKRIINKSFRSEFSIKNDMDIIEVHYIFVIKNRKINKVKCKILHIYNEKIDSINILYIECCCIVSSKYIKANYIKLIYDQEFDYIYKNIKLQDATIELCGFEDYKFTEEQFINCKFI